MEVEKICKKAIDKWGREKQMDLVVEELSELIKAIVKYRRYDGNELRRNEVLEEIADVQIMMVQAIIMFSRNSEDYDRVLKYKLDRLTSLLGEDDNNENETTV